MKNDEFTQIRVYKKTRSDMEKIRIFHRETYDEIISRLIVFYIKEHNE